LLEEDWRVHSFWMVGQHKNQAMKQSFCIYSTFARLETDLPRFAYSVVQYASFRRRLDF